MTRGLLTTLEWPSRSGYDSFPMPEKTRQQSRLHLEENLPVQSMLIFDASAAVTKGGVQGFPGPPLAMAAEIKSRPAFFETRSPGRGLCPLIAMLPAGAPVPVISAGSLGRVAPEASSGYSGAAPYQSTGLVSPAPAQAYGSSLPDLRPQRSAWKGSPCFKTP